MLPLFCFDHPNYTPCNMAQKTYSGATSRTQGSQWSLTRLTLSADLDTTQAELMTQQMKQHIH